MVNVGTKAGLVPFSEMIPHALSPSGVRAYAPFASGVYGISNASEWIYIGQSDNIQAALQEHLQDVDASIMKRHPTGFVFEICDQTHRLARQGRLVVEYAPACNRGGHKH
jgi:hypothetical protein